MERDDVVGILAREEAQGTRALARAVRDEKTRLFLVPNHQEAELLTHGPHVEDDRVLEDIEERRAGRSSLAAHQPVLLVQADDEVEGRRSR
ncbi:hypothetical protein QEG98_08395 [Myxococcus sp. MxC21-1]|nr:hypothetical protein [Myxococcus sp. MxC21-1]WNZ63707.1 hypothetical protein QEG98_08395 [Myxococcus sp. MxC21-1]